MDGQKWPSNSTIMLWACVERFRMDNFQEMGSPGYRPLPHSINQKPVNAVHLFNMVSDDGGEYSTLNVSGTLAHVSPLVLLLPPPPWLTSLICRFNCSYQVLIVTKQSML